MQHEADHFADRLRHRLLDSLAALPPDARVLAGSRAGAHGQAEAVKRRHPN